MIEVNGKGRFKAAVICALILVSSGLAHGEVQAQNGIQRILDVFDFNRHSSMHNAQTGDEAAVACMEIAFLEWHHLYSTTLSVFLPNQLNVPIKDKFNEAEVNARTVLDELFDAKRPNLSQAIRQTLSELRLQNKAPGIPASLTIEDFQENAFVQNLMFCNNPTFLATIAKIVPPIASGNQMVARTVSVEVPDYDNIVSTGGGNAGGGGSVGAFGGGYIPMRKVKVTEVRKYAEWINILTRGY